MNTSLPIVHSSVSHNERVTAAVAHAGTCVAWFLAPLLVWFCQKDHSPFVERQAMQALLWSALGTVVSLATCGLAMPVFLGFHVYAAICVLGGEDYEYPLVSELARRLSAR